MMWHGMHEVCPGVVNSLGTPSANSAGSRDHTCTTVQRDRTIHRDGQDDETVNSDVPPRSPVGRESKMPHEMLQRDSELRSSGSRF